MQEFSLANQTILITGASSGIGRAVAEACANAGASVVLIARDTERLNQVKRSLTGKGHVAYSLDLSKVDFIASEIETILRELPPINGLVHAAGITATHPFKYAKPDHFQQLFTINVQAALELTRVCTKSFAAKPMSIVFISSVMALVGEKAKAGYSMSKGALLAASRSLALELAAKNIRVNCVSPGVVETPMTKNATYHQNPQAHQAILDKHPLGLGQPKDVASAVHFLLANASSWITGANLVVDGGYTAR